MKREFYDIQPPESLYSIVYISLPKSLHNFVLSYKIGLHSIFKIFVYFIFSLLRFRFSVRMRNKSQTAIHNLEFTKLSQVYRRHNIMLNMYAKSHFTLTCTKNDSMCPTNILPQDRMRDSYNIHVSCVFNRIVEPFQATLTHTMEEHGKNIQEHNTHTEPRIIPFLECLSSSHALEHTIGIACSLVVAYRWL